MDALEIAEALSKAITTRNLSSVVALYTDHTTVWHSYTGVEQNLVATLKFLGDYFSTVETIGYHDVRRTRTEDGYVQQHTLTTTFKDGSELVPRAVCIVARIEGGKIVRIDEYLEARRTAVKAAAD